MQRVNILYYQAVVLLDISYYQAVILLNVLYHQAVILKYIISSRCGTYTCNEDEDANLKLVDVVPGRESFCDIENRISKDKTVSNY